MEYYIRNDFIELGRRVEIFNQKTNSYISEEKRQLMLLNLRFNLSRFIALLIKEAQHPDRSIAHIRTLIANHNNKNGTNICIERLMENGFIRIILGKVYLARSVICLAEKVTESNKEKEYDKDDLDFLSEINEEYYKIKTKIPCNRLEEIIKLETGNQDCFQYLKNQEYLVKSGDSYIWRKDDVSSIDEISDEIITHLWFSLDLKMDDKLNFIARKSLETKIHSYSGLDFLNADEQQDVSSVIAEIISLEIIPKPNSENQLLIAVHLTS